MPSYQPVSTSTGLAPTHTIAVTAVRTVNRTAKTKGSGSHRLEDLRTAQSNLIEQLMPPFNTSGLVCETS